MAASATRTQAPVGRQRGGGAATPRDIKGTTKLCLSCSYLLIIAELTANNITEVQLPSLLPLRRE